MVGCSVLGCKSRSEDKKDITFHKFPFLSDCLDKWTAATGRKNWAPTKYSRICSRHFKERLLIRKQTKTQLTRDAVPSIDVNEPVQIKSEYSEEMQATPISSPEHVKSESSEEMEVFLPEPDEVTEKLESPVILTKKLQKAQSLAKLRLRKLRTMAQQKRRLERKVANLIHVIQELKGEGKSDLLDSVNKIFLKNGKPPAVRCVTCGQTVWLQTMQPTTNT